MFCIFLSLSFSLRIKIKKCYFPSFILIFHFSPQEASGKGPVRMEPDTSPSQFYCFISSCGIISGDVLLSSHCVETLVLCQTVGQGAPNQNIQQSRREITGVCPVPHTGSYICLLLCVLLKVNIWLVLDISCQLLLFFEPLHNLPILCTCFFFPFYTVIICEHGFYQATETTSSMLFKQWLKLAKTKWLLSLVLPSKNSCRVLNRPLLWLVYTLVINWSWLLSCKLCLTVKKKVRSHFEVIHLTLWLFWTLLSSLSEVYNSRTYVSSSTKQIKPSRKSETTLEVW